MAVLTRQRNRRRAMVALAVTAVAVAAATAIILSRDDAPVDTGGVPTVPVANTPADIGCVDEQGQGGFAPRYWLSTRAQGAIAFEGEISSSVRIGGYARTVLDTVASAVGPYSTSEVRDLSPAPSYCVTHRVVTVVFADGTELDVIALRLVAQASPQWIPNQAEFAAIGDAQWASTGANVRSVVTVAEDGTMVAVVAYGAGARAMLSDPVGATATSVPVGSVALTVEQLAVVAGAALDYSVRR